MGNWYTETLRTNSPIQKSYVRHLALKCSALNVQPSLFWNRLVQRVSGEWLGTHHHLLWRVFSDGWDVWAKNVREVKCWMGLVGCKSPCSLVLADEKITELRPPLWSELGKAGGDFHGRREVALRNCTTAIVFAGERQKNHIQGHWMHFGF